MRRLLVPTLALTVSLLLACGGSVMNPANSASMALMIQDTPPSGVTILRFEITVTSATLQPSDTSAMAVSLLNVPAKIDLEQLETETAFLNTSSATAGAYSSLSVTFSNPELTILNQSGQSFSVGNASCANGAICKLEPALSPATVSISSSPFPITIGATAQTGLLLDFDVNASVQGNLSVSPSITVKQVTAPMTQGELEDVDDLVGSVTGATSNQFTLLDNSTGKSFSINVNNNTEFEFEGCSVNNFTCLTVGEIIKVDLNVMPNGSLTARKIELQEQQNEEEAEGTVVSVNAPAGQFQIVALDNEPNIANVILGTAITVQIQQGAAFEVDSDGLNVPSGLSFSGIQSVIVGQKIQVRPRSISVGPPVTISTDRVRLRTSQLTATVASVATPNFIVNNLPGLFTAAGISQIQVVTSSQTDFDGLSGISNLAPGAKVSARGLLFGPTSGATLVAAKVRSKTN
jgi:hypothetical protein